MDGIERPPATRRSTGWWIAFALAAVVHVSAQALGRADLADLTKPTLMPLLAGVAWTRLASGTLRTRVLLALAASLAGDVALMGDGEAWFLAGVGAFLVAQLTYLTAFRPWWARSVVRRRPSVALPYVALLGALLAAVLPGIGPLAVPVTVYGCVIVAMALAATGVSTVTALGAASFVVSDALIALTGLTDLVALPRPGAWVMATYAAGQAAIVAGLPRSGAPMGE